MVKNTKNTLNNTREIVAEHFKSISDYYKYNIILSVNDLQKGQAPPPTPTI